MFSLMGRDAFSLLVPFPIVSAVVASVRAQVISAWCGVVEAFEYEVAKGENQQRYGVRMPREGVVCDFTGEDCVPRAQGTLEYYQGEGCG